MFGHYLTTALRNFWRFRFTSLINVLGLALGLTCFLAAYGAVRYLESSDKHFANADRTYVITQRIALPQSGINTGDTPYTPTQTAKYLRADFPQLEAVARENPLGEIAVTGQRRDSLFPLFADPELLDIFDLPFLAGDAKNALRHPRSAVLTVKAAERLFDTRDVLGRSIRLANMEDVTITGVVGDIRQPSHFGDTSGKPARFDILVSYDTLLEFTKIVRGAAPEPPENWLSRSGMTYVLLPRDGSLSPTAFAKALQGFADRHVPPSQRTVSEIEFGAIPVSQLQLSTLDAVVGNGNFGVATLLLLVGGLVLLTACLNYANLATAQATMRAKAVGLRRVLGARGGQLMAQYFLESAMLTIAALGLALLAVALLAPLIQAASTIEISLPLQKGLAVWLYLGLLVGVVTIVAGLYPALVLSRVRPVQALRGAKLELGARLMPTLLVGIQFAVASFLLIAVIVISAQNRDLRQTAFGRTTDPNVVITQTLLGAKVALPTLRAELLKHPEIKSVGAIGQPPWRDGYGLALIKRSLENGAKSVSPLQNNVGGDFFGALDMKFLAGRGFDTGRDEDSYDPAGDTPRTSSTVVDRALAEQLGWSNPNDALDQIVYVMDKGFDKPPSPLRIVGVVENRPLTFYGGGSTANIYLMPRISDTPSPSWLLLPVVRIDKDKVVDALRVIDEVWNDLSPDTPIKRRFMDELFEESYKTFGVVNQVFAGLAAFAFVISIMGLFGMAVFVTGRRMHEIGIRKTLGASAGDILRLLLASFSRPVVIANLLVWPLAYLAAQAYLSVFVHRITLTPVPFVLSLVITLLIAWIAVGAQAWRAARVKPATVLRYE